MAYITEFECRMCGEEKRECVSGLSLPYTCCGCRLKVAVLDKKCQMEKLKMLPIEKRLAIIEEFLYDSDMVNRISRIETSHTTY